MPLNPHAFARLRNKKRPRASSTASSAPSTNSRPVSSSSKPQRTFKERRAADLEWHKITLPAELGFDDDGGLLELDEIEGVDVQYQDGKVVFKTREEDDAPPAKRSKKGKDKAIDQDAVDDDGFVSAFPDEELDLPEAEDELNEAEDVEEQEDQPDVVEKKEDKAALAKAKAKEKAKEKAKAKKRAREEAKESVVMEEEPVEEELFDVETALPAWSHLSLPTSLYRALAESKFTKPTEIQDRALRVNAPPPPPAEDEEGFKSAFETADAERERDVVGIAQTGSGKTLAYGLPILSHILSTPLPSSSPSNSDDDAEDGPDPTRLAALILCPTRELALQVRAALSALAVRTLPLRRTLSPELEALADEDPRKRQKGRLVNVVALTGGMSVEKQKRQLEKGADIVVATPGRLWDLIGESDLLVREIKGMKFLVIDEADRMIENGHYAELDNIVKLTRRVDPKQASTAGFTDAFPSAAITSRSDVNTLPARADMRTFVFSATMSKELQQNFKRKGGITNRRWVPPTEGAADMSSLDDLLDRLDFRDPEPEIIDLSPEHGLVETLKECKVECLQNEKACPDIHLYHFLLRYPARTIVFLASIDGIRRLLPLLTLLKLNVIAIHSGMQQRQRLKALDRFKSSPTAILLATDVAARGLDIPSVSHVVHFQLPRAADTYVHRSGRTARAGTEGLALQLVAPEEKNAQRMLMASLGKTTDLPTLPSEFSILDQLKQRILLAREIDQAQHRASKQAHDDKWLRDAATAMEIDLDDEDSVQASSRKERGKAAAQVKGLKAQLDQMLKKPLMVRGVSAKYITTRGTAGLVDQLVSGTGHGSILGVQASTALDDLKKAGGKKEKKKVLEAAEGKKAKKPQAAAAAEK
ncbi:hypothetical protein JCM8097_008757 [Rhodosporidiobolus ruineniae]